MKLLYQEVDSCIECYAYHSGEDIFYNVDGHEIDSYFYTPICPKCPLPDK